MSTSPCQRSLKELRKAGWTCEVTERWNPFAKRRVDLWGFCDVLAMSPTLGILAVQTTSGPNVSARLEKIKGEPKAAIWLASGGRIVVHGWRKVGARGKRKVWECREVEVTKAEPVEYPHHD